VANAVQELTRASEVCGRIAWSGFCGDVTPALLEPVAAFLGAETASFRWFADPHHTPAPITIGIAAAVNEAYVARFHKLDPARRLIGRPLTEPLFASAAGGGEWAKERAAPAELERYRAEFQEYHREFLLPSNFYHHVGFCIRDARGRALLFDFHRPAGAPDFGTLELARARIVAVFLHAKAVARNEQATSLPANFDDVLSARELEVAEAVALGLSNKQIAAMLDISVRTVENHMRSIFDKLGVTTRTSLAAKLYEATGKNSVAAGKLS
jgi:DNA-binding CsgD family transcriptional regulator